MPIQTSILESALYVTDLQRDVAFYTRLLDQEPYRYEHGRHCFFRLGGSMLLLFNASETIQPNDVGIPTHGASGVGHVCLSSRPLGVDKWRDRLKTLGIAIEREFTWENGTLSLYFRDPSNNSLEIAPPQLWEFPSD